MEHQSAVAYGNGFSNGYKGRDLSVSGWGLKWDFIIIHESGHEWFGNNISAQDVADNWIHESFTSYSENLYTEFLFGKKAGAEYVTGTRKLIVNDIPVIGKYNLNSHGSTDMYYKGSNMLHTIRQLVNNDVLWKQFLRDINQQFWHQTVTTKQIEDYMIQYLKLDLQKVFDQYLRSTKIPALEYKLNKSVLSYRWSNCMEGFDMPVKITSGTTEYWLKPTQQVQKIKLNSKQITVDSNFLITTQVLN
jgi:aminopeptidase N